MTDTKMSCVYKLVGESYEITESPLVFSTYELAKESIKDWEDFLGCSTEEALEEEEVMIEQWKLV